MHKHAPLDALDNELFFEIPKTDGQGQNAPALLLIVANIHFDLINLAGTQIELIMKISGQKKVTPEGAGNKIKD